MADPLSGQLSTAGLQKVNSDPPFDKILPSLDEVREAVARVRGGKGAGVCNISVVLKAGGVAMVCGLTAEWQSGTIPPDWKRELVVPIWKGKGDRQDCNIYHGIMLLNVPDKMLAHLLLLQICSQPLTLQRLEITGFTHWKLTTNSILAAKEFQ